MISYTDSEVRTFHPLCEKALTQAIAALGLSSIYEAKHHVYTGNIVRDDIPSCSNMVDLNIVSKNLRHLPISASFHPDIVLHIPVVHQWQVHLMHSLIRV